MTDLLQAWNPTILHLSLCFVCRTSMQLNIGYEDIKAILKDGRTVNLSYQEKDLKNLLTCQVR